MAHPAHVVLVTDDPHLRELVTSRKPPGAEIAVRPIGDFDDTQISPETEYWLDRDAVCPERFPPCRRWVFFQSTSNTNGAPGLLIRKPCAPAMLDLLWAGVDLAPTRTAAPWSAAVLPTWICDYHHLDLRTLLRAITRTLPKRLGYERAALWLHEPSQDALIPAAMSHDDVQILSTRLCDEERLVRAAISRPAPIRADSLVELATRLNIDCNELSKDGPTERRLIAPLRTADQFIGTIVLAGGDADPETLHAAQLSDIFAFIARAVDYARQFEVTRVEARVDGLTGLFNYRWIRDVLERERLRAERFRTGLALLMLDLDHLKCINDNHGHAFGNRVLRQLAAQISGALRRFDTAARIGGDEFLILLPSTDLLGARQVGYRLMESVRSEPLTIAHQTVPVSISIGVAQWIRGWNSEQFIDAADHALYAAKRNGRNQVFCSTECQSTQQVVTSRDSIPPAPTDRATRPATPPAPTATATEPPGSEALKP